MYGLRNRGMAAADPNNPDVPYSPCATRWAWAIPTCWGWTNDLIYGDQYRNPPMPPAVGSTVDGLPIPAVPESGQAATETIQAITNAQIRATQAQNQQFFEDLNPKVNPPGGIPWWAWLAGAVGVFALVAVSGGSPRRYGR